MAGRKHKRSQSEANTIDPASLPYRAGVGIVVLNAQGLVFVGRRIDTQSAAWQMPQGGIDEGEDPRSAALRELREETGIQSVQVLAETPDWLCYDLPPHLVGVAWRGRYRGQRQKWFAVRFTGPESEIDLNATHAEFNAWAWMPMESLEAHAVPFKRALYRDVVAQFLPLAKPVADGSLG